MNSYQKTIKYIAGGFAILLAVSIIAFILNAAVAIASNLSGLSGGGMSDTQSFQASQVKSLKINAVGKLTIIPGEGFTVDANNVGKGYTCVLHEDGELVIDASRFYLFGFNSSNELTVEIPKDMFFENIRIKLGAGSAKIVSLEGREIEIVAGVGELDITNITAEEASFEIGVGKLDAYDITVKEKGTFDTGIGDLSVRLNGRSEDYRVKVEAGIGKSSLNGSSYSSSYWRNMDSASSITANAGIGSANVKFLDD